MYLYTLTDKNIFLHFFLSLNLSPLEPPSEAHSIPHIPSVPLIPAKPLSSRGLVSLPPPIWLSLVILITLRFGTLLGLLPVRRCFTSASAPASVSLKKKQQPRMSYQLYAKMQSLTCLHTEELNAKTQHSLRSKYCQHGKSKI